MAEKDDADTTTIDPMAEISAMKKIAEALENLDEHAVGRVLRWAGELHGMRVGTAQHASLQASVAPVGSRIEDQHSELPDFYAACNPGTDAEKGLVVGYWLQYREGAQDFDSQRVNTELKHLGYPIGNITRAFDNLENSQPKLVIQVRKLGNTKQARKRLKLTVEGKKLVEQMLSNHAA